MELDITGCSARSEAKEPHELLVRPG